MEKAIVHNFAAEGFAPLLYQSTQLLTQAQPHQTAPPPRCLEGREGCLLGVLAQYYQAAPPPPPWLSTFDGVCVRGMWGSNEENH